MRDDQIRVKPFELLEVNHFSMIKKENEHAVVSFSGRILDTLEEAYIKMALENIDAEVVVLQSMEPDAMEDILHEAKKNDVGRAASFLNEAAKTMSILKNLGIKGISDVVDGVNLMVQAQNLQTIGSNPKDMSTGKPPITGGQATPAISPMDVVSALPISEVLKSKGVQSVLSTLNLMKQMGVLQSLKSKSPAEVAKSDAATSAIYKEAILLKGVVTELSVKTQNQVKILSGTIKSPSCLMDITPHIRTWQVESITYNDMMNTILDPYKDKDPGCIMTVEDSPIETFVLQYKETDWQFAQRMASHQNKFLVADDLTGGVRFYYGMPEPRTEKMPEFNTNSYNIQKRLTEYLGKRDDKVPDILEKDSIYYQICIRDVFYIGDKVNFNGQELRVCRIESSLRGSEIYHNYTLKTENGFNLPRAFNPRSIGVSLSGIILEPSKDVVKIAVDEDENIDGCQTRWFPYSTVYSTPDGTGWYCMPEPGDAIRLYMPSDDEREAYVISAVHLATNNNEERSTPDNKSIMNKYGKEILMTPGTLVFTNNNGMSVSILDDEGIVIVSDKKIEITSKESVSIQSQQDQIVINAPNSVNFVQGGTKVTLKENIVIEGAQTNIQ